MLLAAAVVAGSAATPAAADTYRYDELGRLIRVTYANGAVVQYSYDAAGNRTTVVAALDGGVTPPVNRAPVAENDAYDVERGTLADLYVLDNDSDPDGDALTITSVTGPGATVGTGGAYIQFNPVSLGTKTVSYTISDGRGGTASATATILVYRIFPTAASAGDAKGSSPAPSSSSTGLSEQG